MNYEVLVSTMNGKIKDNKNLYNMENLLIINQGSKLDSSQHIVNTTSKGLSNSRNIGLKESSSDICFISDDDVTYNKNLIEKISSIFIENESVDIVTFINQSYKENGLKKYKNYQFKHNYRTIRKVSSIEIAVRRKSILENGIRYNPNFGLGAMYPIGEEILFLRECLKKKLNVMYFPIPLVFHPELSTGQVLNLNKAFSQGAFFKCMYPYFYGFAIVLFAFRKRKMYSSNYIQYVSSMFSGAKDYSMMRDDESEM